MSSSNSIKETFITPLCKPTPLSKYFALVLFVILLFVGGLVGYNLAPEKVVEVEVTKLLTVAEEPVLPYEKSKLEEGTYQFETYESNYELDYDEGRVRLYKTFKFPSEVSGVVTVRWNYYGGEWGVAFKTDSATNFIDSQYEYYLLDVDGNSLMEEICALVSCPLEPSEETKQVYEATATLRMNVHKVSDTIETQKESWDSLYVSEVTPI